MTVSSGQISHSAVNFETASPWRQILIVNLNCHCCYCIYRGLNDESGQLIFWRILYFDSIGLYTLKIHTALKRACVGRSSVGLH